MGNRAFQMTVVLLWFSTMGWLFLSKVLPPLLVGEPPTLRSTVPATDVPLCWRLEWNGQSVGWAASQAARAKDGGTEIRSRLVLSELPLREMSPFWLHSLLRSLGKMDMDACSRVEIDPQGAFQAIHSTVRVGQLADAVQVTGQVVDYQLAFEVRSGEFTYKKRLPLSPDSLVASELSPQAELPHLRVGQSWTMPVYSPFYPNQPMEILEAMVEEEGLLRWDEKMQRTLIVKYRQDSGAGLLTSNKPRSVLWVAADGRVLQQETTILNSKLRFIRMTPAEATAHLDAFAGKDWLTQDLSQPRKMSKETRMQARSF